MADIVLSSEDRSLLEDHSSENDDVEESIKMYRNMFSESYMLGHHELYTPLHWAAGSGKIEFAEYLIVPKNSELNLKSYDGSTPVVLAAANGCKDIVDLLLKFGADVNCSNEVVKWTFLHYASQQGWLDTVKCIVKYGEMDLNVKTSLGITPLLLAVDAGHTAVVEFFIRAGADVNCCDDDSWTALHYASKSGSIQIVKCILESTKCDVNAKNSSGNTPLHIACGMNNTEIVNQLLEAGADFNIRNNKNKTAPIVFPMHISATRGDIESVKELIKQGMSINEQDMNGCTPLHRAAEYGQLEVSKYLIQNKCDLNYKSRDQHENTPMLLALERGHHDVVELLIREGADVNCRSRTSSMTVLHQSSMHGFINIVKCIVEYGGANLNIKTSHEVTPLMHAAACEHKEVVELLLQSGADANCRGGLRQTVLHHVCLEDLGEMLQIFLKHENINLNAKDIRSNTPLHTACWHDSENSIKQLLVKGAQVNIKNVDNETPLNDYVSNIEYYKDRGDLNLEVIRLFVENGAYFEAFDYEKIYNNPFLREKVFRDVELCTQVIINRFNNDYLPSVYNIPGFVKILPRIKTVEIKSTSGVAHEIQNFVHSEIQRKVHCNVLEACPIVLKLMCIKALNNYHSAIKRSALHASSNKDSPAKKPRLN